MSANKSANESANKRAGTLSSDFDGLVAVVTGAAQGIGRGIAAALHARGARVLLLDRNANGLTAVAESLRGRGGPSVNSIVVDLADAAAIAALTEQVAALESKVDVLVNNAGIEYDLPFEEITAELFDRVIAVNQRAPFLLTRALAPLFPTSGGAIVNISSIHADHAFPNAIPYACSKAALVALTRNLALELAPRRIRVNAICPGYIESPMLDEWLQLSPDPEALLRQVQELHPLGRVGTPCDVAAAVAFLAGPSAAWITGTVLVVDGGLTIRAHP
jgi:NAD(P)-dependent dehydrogenase (short-subunit alcohol dehydrogenase family)